MPKKHGRDDLPAFFRESPNDLEKVSRKKVVVLLDFVQMRGRGALPKFVVHFSQTVYDSLSDVGEIRVYFASKILTPCRMH